MARYAIYGSTGENRASSLPSSLSNSFTTSSIYKNSFPNKIKPLNLVDLDKGSKESVPNNVYMSYDGLQVHSNNYMIGDLSPGIDNVREQLHKSLNIYEENAQNTFLRYINYYNRFKVPTLNDAFQKGFAHVFFVRPDCNILDINGANMIPAFENDPEFSYVWKNSPDLVRQLSLYNGQGHDFMLYLSNKAASFSTSDEYINAENYGKTFKGWQISYGRNNVESKTSGDFSVTYTDDRSLHVYHLHRLWVDYISDVYQGKKSPREYNIRNKILDYASACYYLITAEDGETIIFWTKYYGVFPTTIPSNQYSWAKGNIIENPSIDIKYQFSFKEDMNPEALAEFNINSKINGNTIYVPTYDPRLGHVGTTWVGAPYIELVTNNTDPDCPYTFKLRFRSVDD